MAEAPQIDVRREIARILKERQTFLILPHVSIDGDDLGSMLALKRALEQMGKQVFLYSSDRVPRIFRFLPQWQEIKPSLPAQRAQVAIVLECTRPERLGEGLSLESLADFTINIDHHPGNAFYADLNWVEQKAAAVGELVFELLGQLGVPLDYEMAQCLYVALVTDTGGFQYSNVTSRTHHIASELLRFPLPVAEISRKIYREKDFGFLQLFAKVASTMELAADGRIAWAVMTRAMLEDCGVRDEDTQSFVEELNQLSGVEVVALFKEKPENTWRVSMRSATAPINEVAASFGGGGHQNAAGCTVTGPLEHARAVILPALEALIERTVPRNGAPTC